MITIRCEFYTHVFYFEPRFISDVATLVNVNSRKLEISSVRVTSNLRDTFETPLRLELKLE